MTLPLPSSPHWPPTRMMTTGLLGARFGPARLQVVEPGVVAAELELDHAGGTVAMLGNDHFGDSRPLVGFVVLGSKQKHHEIRILLNRTGFSKVAEYRALVGPLFWCSAQLGDRDHWHTQLPRQSLERTRNR